MATEYSGLFFKVGLGERIFLRAVRNKAAEKAFKSGLYPTKDAALKAVTAVLDDKDVLEFAARPEVGAIGDGKILKALGGIVDWVINNQDKIAKVVQFILSLLPLFMETDLDEIDPA